MIKGGEMRRIFKVLVLLVAAITVMAGSSQTSFAYTITVKNDWRDPIDLWCYAGALGSLKLFATMQPGQTHTFDTGAECPISLDTTICGIRNEYDIHGHSVFIRDCGPYTFYLNGGIHACWNSRWRLGEGPTFVPD